MVPAGTQYKTRRAHSAAGRGIGPDRFHVGVEGTRAAQAAIAPEIAFSSASGLTGLVT